MKKLAAATLSALFAAAACAPVTGDESPAEPQAAFHASILDSTRVWKVKTALNCRVAPGTSSGVVFDLQPGMALDVVDSSRARANGYTWIHVNPRGDIDHNTCFVAADSRFLEPANHVDADNYRAADLYEAAYLINKVALNCRENPSTSAPVIFQAMPPGTRLDVQSHEEFHLTWNNDSWWLLVNPVGDVDHNLCWVAARRSLVKVVSLTE